MIRASTTPSTSRDLLLDRLGDLVGLRWFLPVMRTLIGVDLPSFIAARIMPPASKANSRSANASGSSAKPSRSRWTYSCAELVALVLELDLDHRVHRPGVGGVGGRPVGVHADLGDDQLQVVADRALRHSSSTSATRLLGLLDPRAGSAPHVDLEGAGVDLGEELAAELRPEPDDDATSSANAPITTSQRMAHHRRAARGRSRRWPSRSAPPSARTAGRAGRLVPAVSRARCGARSRRRGARSGLWPCARSHSGTARGRTSWPDK